MPECTGMFQERLRLLGQTCSNKYLLLPAIFLFLWQVKPILTSSA